MSQAISAYSVEERIVQGETVWVALRARGAEWSGRQWVEKYGDCRNGGSAASNDDDGMRANPATLIAAE
jgi:hypothetical protein